MNCLFDVVNQKAFKTSSGNAPLAASRAVVSPGLFWPNGYSLKIAFLNDVKAEDYKFNHLSADYAAMKNAGQENDIDPLQFDAYGILDAQALVTKVIVERFAPHVNLIFIFIQDPKEYSNADIRIRFDLNTQNASSSGTTGLSIAGSLSLQNALSEQYNETMLFYSIEIDVILHEFMHALGFQHELFHRNININLEVLQCWLRYLKLPEELAEQFIKSNASAFLSSESLDEKSIMKYNIPRKVQCSDNVFKELYSLTNSGSEEMIQKRNFKLSLKDIQTLQEIYPKAKLNSRTFEGKIIDSSDVNFRWIALSAWIVTALKGVDLKAFRSFLIDFFCAAMVNAFLIYLIISNFQWRGIITFTLAMGILSYYFFFKSDLAFFQANLKILITLLFLPTFLFLTYASSLALISALVFIESRHRHRPLEKPRRVRVRLLNKNPSKVRRSMLP